MDRRYIESTFSDLAQNINHRFGDAIGREIEPEELERVVRNYVGSRIKDGFYRVWNGNHGFDSNGNIIRRNH
jgi:hypothetical protein